MRPRLAVWIVLVAALAGARAAHAQQPRAALGQDSAQVGDVVPVAVRLTVAPGERVIFPDTLPVTGELENASRVRERVDTLADGTLQVTAIYEVTPWTTGPIALPELALTVVGGDESPRTLAAALPSLTVVSVLPADTAGIEPKPAKGVIGRNWPLLPIIALLILLALLAAALWWWVRRRSRREGPVELVPGIPPREAALATLQRARDSGLLEQGEMKEFYTLVSEAVRRYTASLNDLWGEEWTTTEVTARVRAVTGLDAARDLGAVLRAADQVKFAKRRPDRQTALQEWEAARRWITDFDGPPPATAVDREQAA